MTRKVLALITTFFQYHPGEFRALYRLYGGNLKCRVLEDPANRKTLSKLLMFYTMESPNDPVTLDDYVSRMKPGQAAIYYTAADSREAAARSPFLEGILNKGYEAIFAVEPIDVYCLDSLESFEGKPVENPEKGRSRGDEEELAQLGVSAVQFRQVGAFFRRLLGEQIESVVLSKALLTVPAICVAPERGVAGSAERLAQAQTVHDRRLTDIHRLNRKLLELNPRHPLIREVVARVIATPDDAAVRDDCLVLFDTALVAGGFEVEDVSQYSRRLFRLLGKAHGWQGAIEGFEAEHAARMAYLSADEEKAAAAAAQRAAAERLLQDAAEL